MARAIKTDREFWREVFQTCIIGGKQPEIAVDTANLAIKNQPKP